jgi:hypothetical protein
MERRSPTSIGRRTSLVRRAPTPLTDHFIEPLGPDIGTLSE